MAEIRFIGRQWKWLNNRMGEGFVEERLDRFFAFLEWMVQNPHAMVSHIQKQASNHCLLLLDKDRGREKPPRRFYFDKRYLELPDFEQVVD